MTKLRKYGRWYFLLALALTAGSIWGALFWAEARHGLMFLHVFDVGQGDAVFIEAPNGSQILIDGGPDTSVVAQLGTVMPFWDRSIDLVVLTHPHADHLDGLLAVLERYTVGQVLESGVNHTIAEYGEWREDIQRRGIPRAAAVRGQHIRLGGDAFLRVLAPFRSYDGQSVRNIHESAVVLQLGFASSSALLMSDAELPLERMLIASGDDLRAEVLKVGHHGSRTSTSDALLASVRPTFAAISAGRRNRYGHPVQEVLDRLARFGVQVFRTDRDGVVTFVSDGRSFTIR